MNSSDSSPTPAPARSPVIRLEVLNHGHVPAMKNAMFAIVDKGKRSWKHQCVQDFVFQLISGLATGGNATLTTAQLLYLTQRFPRDDNWQNIPELNVRGSRCEKGKEGATIIIEEI